MSPEAADLIKKILVLDPNSRLGFKNIEEIKSHPFFKGKDLLNMRAMSSTNRIILNLIIKMDMAV